MEFFLTSNYAGAQLGIFDGRSLLEVCTLTLFSRFMNGENTAGGLLILSL